MARTVCPRPAGPVRARLGSRRAGRGRGTAGRCSARPRQPTCLPHRLRLLERAEEAVGHERRQRRAMSGVPALRASVADDEHRHPDRGADRPTRRCSRRPAVRPPAPRSTRPGRAGRRHWFPSPAPPCRCPAIRSGPPGLTLADWPARPGRRRDLGYRGDPEEGDRACDIHVPIVRPTASAPAARRSPVLPRPAGHDPCDQSTQERLATVGCSDLELGLPALPDGRDGSPKACRRPAMAEVPFGETHNGKRTLQTSARPLHH